MELDLSDLEVVEVLDLARKEHSSRTHPDLPNKPGGPDNWVEKAGGLPSYIKRMAKHIFYDGSLHPRTVDHAVAAAVERCKELAAKGNAQAIAAMAQWEAKRGKARALSYDLAGDAHLVQRRRVLYSTYGNAASSKTSGVKGASFDERKHNRTSGGQFANKLSALELATARRQIEGAVTRLRVGQSFNLPGKVGWVKRTAGGFMIQGNGGFVASVRTISEAITAAAALLARKGIDK